jgi:hypothetical protein
MTATSTNTSVSLLILRGEATFEIFALRWPAGLAGPRGPRMGCSQCFSFVS